MIEYVLVRETKGKYPADGKEGEFALKCTGKDLTKNQGLDWIVLICENCGVAKKFYAKAVVKLTKTIDPTLEMSYEHHCLVVCSSCNTTRYVMADESHIDPEWIFEIVSPIEMLMDDSGECRKIAE